MQAPDERWLRFGGTPELEAPLDMMLSTLPHHTSWQGRHREEGVGSGLQAQRRLRGWLPV